MNSRRLNVKRIDRGPVTKSGTVTAAVYPDPERSTIALKPSVQPDPSRSTIREYIAPVS